MNSERFYELKQAILSSDEDLDVIATELLALSVLNDLSDDYFFCDYDEIVEVATSILYRDDKDISCRPISNIKYDMELKYQEFADKYYDEINEDYEQDI